MVVAIFRAYLSPLEEDHKDIGKHSSSKAKQSCSVLNDCLLLK